MWDSNFEQGEPLNGHIRPANSDFRVNALNFNVERTEWLFFGLHSLNTRFHCKHVCPMNGQDHREDA